MFSAGNKRESQSVLAKFRTPKLAHVGKAQSLLVAKRSSLKQQVSSMQRAPSLSLTYRKPTFKLKADKPTPTPLSLFQRQKTRYAPLHTQTTQRKINSPSQRQSPLWSPERILRKSTMRHPTSFANNLSKSVTLKHSGLKLNSKPILGNSRLSPKFQHLTVSVNKVNVTDEVLESDSSTNTDKLDLEATIENYPFRLQPASMTEKEEEDLRIAFLMLQNADRKININEIFEHVKKNTDSRFESSNNAQN